MDRALELVEGGGAGAVDGDPDRLGEALALALPTRGRPLEDVVDHVAQVLAATPFTSGNRFFNQLFGGRQPAAVAAEMMAPLANSSMYTFKVAGPQILVEREVLRRLLRLVHWDSGEGLFAPGGSLSNLTAMLVARNRALDSCRDDGLDGTRLTFYASEKAHYSIRKNAGILGVGRQAVRTIPTDDAGRMRAGLLEEKIVADIAEGARPTCVVATAGTTVLGAFDPVAEIGEVSRRFGVWLHVDGALGGTVLLSPVHRELLSGIENADSLTWDAHKMMGVPLICSALLMRERGHLAANLDESADYLFQGPEDNLDPGRRSIQCGRRNDALKLWAAWQHLGDDGWAQRVDRQMELANFAARTIREAQGLVLVHEPQSVCVCFEVPGFDSARVCDWLLAERGIRIGHGEVDGHSVIRLVCVNPDLMETDLTSLMAQVREATCALADRPCCQSAAKAVAKKPNGM